MRTDHVVKTVQMVIAMPPWSEGVVMKLRGPSGELSGKAGVPDMVVVVVVLSRARCDAVQWVYATQQL